MGNETASVFPALVQEVLSGDDLVLLVDLGVDGLHKRVRVRLKDVDAPNAIRQGSDTEAGKLRDRVANLCNHSKVTATVVKKTAHAWVVILNLETSDGQNIDLNEMLKSEGYVYRGLRNE
ncbi:endonuclease [Pseudomonas phage SM1]|uniref:TNase-like domain-containing protein n=2 Tax=Samunavirus TaxID=2560221 RepID=A0A0U3CKH9_9CAUD|nr:endonuclease [Pseudomonas phage SM1]UGC97037.1 D11 protein [Pseudomonas phage BHU-1]UGV19994.1 D11 protein [Pseudomonas phage Pa BHU-15]UIW13557.1 D11 protein [Pseudomonas phage Pa BHU-17]UVN14040.1 hypothetical protein FBPa45_0038 [Pseudomonas phage vB_PaeS_FBPa45]WDS62446.1 D11 protein [Pseudomonas phage UF_RH6]HBO9768521.1 hypothetical protein [Pseudomonas aeruginosa]